jgi:inhibitor of KinA
VISEKVGGPFLITDHSSLITVLKPLGDQAVLASFPDELQALRFAARARRLTEPGLLDVVLAYTSVGVYFDLDQTCFARVVEWLRPLLGPTEEEGGAFGRLQRIPCCYEMQLDLERVASQVGLSCEEVIRLHSETVYTVYAIGFCPGFPYLGYLPTALVGVPRLDAPRLRVEAGSVGLAGRQTGVYTEPRPGGWNLIGRTPLQLVDVADGYFPLHTGDRVQFVRIDETEYRQLQGQRL